MKKAAQRKREQENNTNRTLGVVVAQFVLEEGNRGDQLNFKEDTGHKNKKKKKEKRPTPLGPHQ